MTRRPAYFMCLWLLVGCQGEPNIPPPIFVDESAVVFDTTVLHEVELIVAPEFLPELSPDNEIRVPATIIYDGVTVEDVGIRLKGFIGSVQTLDGKPGFSVKFNEFVEGQKLHGLKKFTLNNSIQDPSFVSEHLGYEIWRRAGVPAPRTAHARLTFNGEYFGVYVVKESINSTFVKRNFENGEGNAYEGIFGVDVVDTDGLDLDTNNDINDRSDAIALREIILSSPDEQFLEDISTIVDVDEFLTFWAVEALTYHWDGYAQFGTFGCCSPNNYYMYFEPTLGKFFFLPHGADQLFQDLTVNITNPPSPGASLATRLFAFEEIRQRFADEVRRVLVEAWDTEALEARMDDAFELIEESVLEFDRNPNFNPVVDLPNAIEFRRQYLQERPGIVLEDLANAGF